MSEENRTLVENEQARNQSAEQEEESPEVSWQELSAAAAAVGVYAYVVGAAALLVPVARMYMNSDLATAWYAVSLVPKHVIVGHAARIAISRIGLLLSIIVVALMLYFVWEHLKRKDKSLGNVRIIPTLVILSLLTMTLLVLVMIAVLMWHFVAREYELSESFFGLIPLGINALVLTAAPILLWRGLELGKAIHLKKSHERGYIPLVKNGPRLLAAALVYFVVAYTGVLAAAMVSSPPLPHAEMHGRFSGGEIRGELLTHADGFWYIFIRQEEVKLLAISDDKVDQVQVTSKYR